uniref:Phosphoribosyl-AMP cyclohydrolase domain-containing protein n=1 Tax=Ditylum brightwellii TaxID=49249 RepID=A0A6V2F3Z5_9STRA|mmetsp:Transcript_1567/g.2145  ORF Transcript_1567/g.2145 Transcript_1567/m.2145 type:complete len:469 (+) Transcript_1567:187-1593(+)
MTSLPYPSFCSNLPSTSPSSIALSAVGRCRINPNTIPATTTADAVDYKSIVSKCTEQGQTDEKEDKKLRKKYMKQGVALAQSYLSQTLNLDVSIVDVEIVLENEDVLNTDGCLASCFLDAGCARIVVNGTSDKSEEVMEVCRLPKERMVAHVTLQGDSVVVEKKVLDVVSNYAATISVAWETFDLEKLSQYQEEMQKLIKEGPDDHIEIVLQIPSSDDIDSILGAVCKKFKGHGTIALIDPTATQLGMSFAACCRTDRPDGLYTTVVCTRSNEALGLVYSSKESIVAALECGRGVYYSRSRKGLWRKGDTSGHFQSLHRIDVDCDSDAIRFMVTQHGDDVAAFCHLNTFTCWGEPHGLRHLEGTLKKRLNDAPAGSYTKRLFDDEQLLRDKLVEEAQELSEAENKQHAAEELADVLYFAMVKAAKMGVSIDDAAAELDKRSRKVTRRKGDSKAFRIAKGDEILGKSQE